MALHPGCRLVVAPLFHLAFDWCHRLLVESDAGWRTLEEQEQRLLVPDPTAALARSDLPECLCLFQLPQHLGSAWRRLLEQAQERGALSPEQFDAFVARVAGFLAFKELPLKPGAVFDLLVSQPGERSISLPWQQLWGGVNVGGEATSLLFAGSQLAESPWIRLRLEPGEGFRMPAGGMLVAGCTLDKEEPDALLLVRHDRTLAAPGKVQQLDS